MPLEGLWWVADMADFDPTDKSNWSWTAMICLPDAVTDEMAAEVIAAVTAKKDLVAGPKARVERFTEGVAAQILHIGPYADEAPTIDELHEFIDSNGHKLAGKHHEIYLSDPRRAANPSPMPDRVNDLRLHGSVRVRNRHFLPARHHLRPATSWQHSGHRAWSRFRAPGAQQSAGTRARWIAISEW